MRKFHMTMLLAAATIGCGAPRALACAEPVAVVHDRELALLDTAIRTFKLTDGQLAKAKDLREQSEALYQAKNLSQARETLHSALIAVGHKNEPGIPAKGVAPIAIEPQAAVPEANAAPSAEAGVVGCGAAGTWQAPGH